MPQAAQIADSFHVAQLLMRATDPVRCTQRRDCEERGARPREDTSQGGARLPDGKAMQDVYGCPNRKSTAKAPDRLCSDDALCRGRDEERGEDPQEGAGRHPQLVEEEFDQFVPGRPQFRRPVRPQHRQGLQEHRLLRGDDLPQTGKLNFSAQRQLACTTH